MTSSIRILQGTSRLRCLFQGIELKGVIATLSSCMRSGAALRRLRT